MNEKRTVYAGYDERYITGGELKQNLEDKYYSDGRHHTRVMGISISDYLTLIGVEDEVVYRVFINKHFCKVMDMNTDKEITFFGHTGVNDIRFSHDPEEIKIELVCPECGSAMKLRNGKYGMFIGCSAYPDCKHKQSIFILGSYKDDIRSRFGN